MCSNTLGVAEVTCDGYGRILSVSVIEPRGDRRDCACLIANSAPHPVMPSASVAGISDHVDEMIESGKATKEVSDAGFLADVDNAAQRAATQARECGLEVRTAIRGDRDLRAFCQGTIRCRVTDTRGIADDHDVLTAKTRGRAGNAVVVTHRTLSPGGAARSLQDLKVNLDSRLLEADGYPVCDDEQCGFHSTAQGPVVLVWYSIQTLK